MATKTIYQYDIRMDRRYFDTRGNEVSAHRFSYLLDLPLNEDIPINSASRTNKPTHFSNAVDTDRLTREIAAVCDRWNYSTAQRSHPIFYLTDSNSYRRAIHDKRGNVQRDQRDFSA